MDISAKKKKKKNDMGFVNDRTFYMEKWRNENIKFYLEMTIMASMYANVKIYYFQKIKSTSFLSASFLFIGKEIRNSRNFRFFNVSLSVNISSM